MTDRAKTPKELLGDHDLIGFTRTADGRDQLTQRASSAKVFTEPASLKDIEGLSPIRTPRAPGRRPS